MKLSRLSIAAAVLASAAAAPLLMPRVAPAHHAENTVPDVAAKDPRLGTLVNLLTSSGLIVILKGHGPFTVFAPTDEAFAALPPDTRERLRTDRSALKRVLLYHTVADRITLAEAKEMTRAKTMTGEDVSITFKGRTLMINDAKVVDREIKASNGVVLVIDGVLLPR